MQNSVECQAEELQFEAVPARFWVRSFAQAFLMLSVVLVSSLWVPNDVSFLRFGHGGSGLTFRMRCVSSY
jgi:hypothetical protein